MKHAILSLVIVLLGSLTTKGKEQAYYETYNIKWSDVKAAIDNSPDSIGALIDRLAAGDSTLRTREILTAYMANSYEHCSPFGDAREARDALHKGEVAKAMSLMDAAIKKNPLSLTNNYYYIVCVHASHPELDEQPNAPLNDSIRQLLELPATRFRLIESAIYYSGNGSARPRWTMNTRSCACSTCRSTPASRSPTTCATTSPCPRTPRRLTRATKSTSTPRASSSKNKNYSANKHLINKICHLNKPSLPWPPTSRFANSRAVCSKARSC